MKRVLLFLTAFFCLSIINGQTSTVYLYHNNSGNWSGDGISGTYRDLAIDSWRFTFQASSNIDNYYKISTSSNNVVNGNVWSGNISIDATSSTTIFDYGDPTGGAGYFPILDGNYYSFIFQDVSTTSNSSGYVLKTSNEPRTITDVSHTNSAVINDNDPVTVTITISGTKSSEENFYVRYTADGWSNSSLSLFSFAGTTGTASIPVQIPETDVEYYIFSTTLSNPSADFDLITLNYDNNSGSNYSYTVKYGTTQAGNWNTSSTWKAGSVPPSGKAVVIGHDVTLDMSPTISSLTINNGVTFTASDGTKANQTLTIADGGTLTNNGTFEASDGTMEFAGAGTVDGSSTTTFNNLEISDGVVVNGNSTISNKLTINEGGYLSQTPGGDGITQESDIPNYSNGATLAFTGNFNLNSLASGWGTTGNKFPTNLSVEGTGVLTMSLSREISGNVDVESGANLNANGNLTLNSDQNGTASLIVSGSVNGNITAERFIDAHTTDLNGWHHLSSPVGQFTISGSSFVPGNNDDFFSWSEADATWYNYKQPEGPDEMLVGEGYLVAYENQAVKSFSGEPHNTDKTFTDLSYTANAYQGWHLIGNPFPCAVQWGTSNWGLSNVSGTAKIWKEADASYIDLDQEGDIIPAMNGFMIHVSNSINSITIPTADRVHSSTAWYKNEEINKLKLKVFDLEGNTAQQSTLKFNANATIGYDSEFDSYYLSGYAPQFYTSIDGKPVSTNTLPQIYEELEVPFYFIKNASSTYRLEIEGTESLELDSPVYLTDNKANQTINLSEMGYYAFEAEEGDEISRFLLHFKSTGIAEDISQPKPQIQLQNNNLHISSLPAGAGNIRVMDITGRVIFTESYRNTQEISIPLRFETGIYIVEVAGETGKYVNKIYIK